MLSPIFIKICLSSVALIQPVQSRSKILKASSVPYSVSASLLFRFYLLELIFSKLLKSLLINPSILISLFFKIVLCHAMVEIRHNLLQHLEIYMAIFAYFLEAGPQYFHLIILSIIIHF